MTCAKSAKNVSRRMLFVEDNDCYRRLVRHVFEKNGWKVVTAGSVLTAMVMLEASDFDFILVDFHLPVYKGTRLEERILKKNIPFAYYTIDSCVPVKNASLLHKSDSMKRLIKDVERIGNGERVISDKFNREELKKNGIISKIIIFIVTVFSIFKLA